MQSLANTDKNFKKTLNLLTEIYYRKHKFLCYLVKKWLFMHRLNNESQSPILNLVDSTNQYAKVTKNVAFKSYETSNIMLLFILQFKLDQTTRS